MQKGKKEKCEIIKREGMQDFPQLDIPSTKDKNIKNSPSLSEEYKDSAE